MTEAAAAATTTAYCLRCRSRRELVGGEPHVTANGRMQLWGTCAHCGAKLKPFVPGGGGAARKRPAKASPARRRRRTEGQDTHKVAQSTPPPAEEVPAADDDPSAARASPSRRRPKKTKKPPAPLPDPSEAVVSPGPGTLIVTE